MKIELGVSLDPTLGCGQAHRWKRTGDKWQGVLGNEVVTLKQTEDGFEAQGCGNRRRLMSYFRSEDDLEEIVGEISKDRYVASLAERCPGLRILKQDCWECLATYLLATNANVARISKMVESVCDCFGKDLGTRHAFPTPSEILNGREKICECRLGFRDVRLINLAHMVENGEIDIDGISELDYAECIEELMKINGVGPKVADCVAIFGYGHLQAFPVDARITEVMKNVYGVSGSYRTVSEYGMNRFGRYAGYAQEFLYHSKFID